MKMKTPLTITTIASMAAVGALAAPSEITNSTISNPCNHRAKPFDTAVCHPFVRRNGEAVAIFINSNCTKAQPKLRREDASATRFLYTEGNMTTCDINGNSWAGSVLNSANINDCLAVQEWAAATPGHWVIAKGDLGNKPWEYTVLITSGSCAFSIFSADFEYDEFKDITIGNLDLIKPIQVTIEKHNDEDWIEAAGPANATIWQSMDKVELFWYISHPFKVIWNL